MWTQSRVFVVIKLFRNEKERVLKPERLLPPAQSRADSQTTLDQTAVEDWVSLSEIEGRYVARVLEHTGGNKQAAARILAVDRKTLDRMIKRHHIIPPHSRQRARVPPTH